MSRARTRSQGPPDVDGSEKAQSFTAQKKMSRELKVRLETLRLQPAQSSKGGETSQPQQQMTAKSMRPASVIPRPQSTIPPTSRSNSAMGIQAMREVSTKFSNYHVMPMHNSTAEDWKQNHTTSLVLPQAEDINETDLEVAAIVEGMMSIRNTSEPKVGEVSPDKFLFNMLHRSNNAVRDSQNTGDNLHNLVSHQPTHLEQSTVKTNG